MPEKNESSPREACGLPKQGNACPYAKLAPVLCARCGWNPDEHARRLELHRMPLLPGTQICPPVEAGDHHNLKGVSKWQKSWARLRTT